jgi:hypothetical protein
MSQLLPQARDRETLFSQEDTQSQYQSVVTHKFNDEVDVLQTIVDLNFLSEIITANTHPTRSGLHKKTNSCYY